MNDHERPADDQPDRSPIDHVQAAAKEMIAATRALLDVAEELVDDPRTATTVANAFTAVGQAAARASRAGRPSSRARDDPDDDGGDRGVQRIPVS